MGWPGDLSVSLPHMRFLERGASLGVAFYSYAAGAPDRVSARWRNSQRRVSGEKVTITRFKGGLLSARKCSSGNPVNRMAQLLIRVPTPLLKRVIENNGRAGSPDGSI